MAEKDFTEKTLEAYNDVFADIINVLLFHGKEVVKEDELEDEPARSIYKADGRLHEQERDVAKYWKNSSVRIALYGFENQTDADSDMSLRVIGYDGAAYRNQLLQHDGSKGRRRYPVVTIVLYFGTERHWNSATTLLERLDVPPELEPFVNDYKINLFEIAWLTDEQVNLFRSDFKIVADYFVQMRKTKNYHPSSEVITHVHEVLELLSVLTQDDRFENVLNEAQSEEGGVQTMCSVLDKVEARGIEIGEARGKARGIEIGETRGIEIGEARGIEIALLQSTRNLMDSLKLSCEQAMELLRIPESDRERYAKLIKNE